MNDRLIKIVGINDVFITDKMIKEACNKFLFQLNISFKSFSTKFEYHVQGASIAEEEISEYTGDPEEIANYARNAEILLVHLAPVTASLMQSAKKLKVICCMRGGPVNVNIKEASAHGVPVINTPGRNANSVAELTIGLLIGLSRNIIIADKTVRKGIWSSIAKAPEADWGNYRRKNFLGFELFGKVLGIIGLGNIGRRVAKIAHELGMKILASDPYISFNKDVERYIKLVPLDTLLSESDIVTIHVKLTHETDRLIGYREIKLLKKNTYIINTSRGRIIDEAALYQALQQKKIAGAALDVYEIEPIEPSNPITKLDNIILTPHIGSSTKGVYVRSLEMIFKDILRLYKGQRPFNCCNPEVLDKWKC